VRVVNEQPACRQGTGVSIKNAPTSPERGLVTQASDEQSVCFGT